MLLNFLQQSASLLSQTGISVAVHRIDPFGEIKHPVLVFEKRAIQVIGEWRACFISRCWCAIEP